MCLRKLLLLIAWWFCPIAVFPQLNPLDNLYSKLKNNNKEDTVKFSVLLDIGNVYQQRNPDSAVKYHTLASELARKLGENVSLGDALKNLGFDFFILGDKEKALKTCKEAVLISEEELKKNSANKKAWKLKTKCLGSIGSIYLYTSDLNKTLEYYRRAFKAAGEWGDKQHMGGMLNNMGLVYKEQSEYTKALDCFFKSLKINEELKDLFSMGKTLDNIGVIYMNQREYDKALDYHERALKCSEAIDNKNGISSALINIGVAYGSMKQEDKALEYYLKALKIDEEIGDPRNISQDLSNIGIVYMGRNDFEKARETLLKAMEIKEHLGDQQERVVTLGSLGELYTLAPYLKPPPGEKLKGYPLAEKYFKEAISISHELKMLNEIQGFESYYSKLDTLRGNWRGAYYHFLNSVSARDTVFKEQNIKNQARLESKYEYDKKETVLKEQQARERAIADERNRRQKLIISGVVVGLLLVIVFAIFVYRSLQTTKNQKIIIEKASHEVTSQKKILEEKNKEILDSITYAKRIQEAILPGEKVWKQHLSESFVIYQPKDIVAGDFYWMEEYNDRLFIAAADCTGHGVPGAMVSVVCSNALTRCVMEEKITDTDKILNRAREIVLEKLTKNEDNIRDGMDVALIRMDKQRNEIQYSGANRPIYIIRNKELIEFKPDKQPIGNFEDAKPFSRQDISYLPGDRIYLFTDGYPDQFGGDKNKKLGNKAFKQLLVEVQAMAIEQQGEYFKNFFANWKKANEQIDDVSVIGIQL